MNDSQRAQAVLRDFQQAIRAGKPAKAVRAAAVLVDEDLWPQFESDDGGQFESFTEFVDAALIELAEA